MESEAKTGKAVAIMPANSAEKIDPKKFKNPFKCLFCGEVYEYGDPNHRHD